MNDHLEEPGGKVRLYVEARLGEGARVAAAQSQAHYLLHVMRARTATASPVQWLRRRMAGAHRRCHQAWLHPSSASGRHGRKQERPISGSAFAPIKKTPADYVAQKATELGVRVLQPVMTRRTIVSRRESGAPARQRRSKRRSNRTALTVPEIRRTGRLETPAGGLAGQRGACSSATRRAKRRRSLRPCARHPAVPGRCSPGRKAVSIRGSATPSAASAFVTPVSLGPRIMRADTAGAGRAGGLAGAARAIGAEPALPQSGCRNYIPLNGWIRTHHNRRGLLRVTRQEEACMSIPQHAGGPIGSRDDLVRHIAARLQAARRLAHRHRAREIRLRPEDPQAGGL